MSYQNSTLAPLPRCMTEPECSRSAATAACLHFAFLHCSNTIRHSKGATVHDNDAWPNMDTAGHVLNEDNLAAGQPLLCQWKVTHRLCSVNSCTRGSSICLQGIE